MNKNTSYVLTTAAALAASVMVCAQNTPQDRPQQNPRPTQPGMHNNQGGAHSDSEHQNGSQRNVQLERASKIIGTNVKNSAGESLGEIDNLALDTKDGRVAFVVLSFGGIMNMGDKLFAVPFESFEFNRLNKVAVLNVDKSKLQNAPGFDKNNWPDMANSQWGTDVYRYYNRSPYWSEGSNTGSTSGGKTGTSGAGSTDDDQGGTGMQDTHTGQTGKAGGSSTGTSGQMAAGKRSIIKASDVIGMDARNSADENLGDIDDVVIELNRGQIAYAVLASGGFLGMGEKMFALPWQTINFTVRENALGMDRKVAVLNIQKDRLKEAPGFDKDRWPDMADARWTREVNTFYGAEPTWSYGYSGTNTSNANANNAGGWDRAEYNQKYDASKVTTINGTITNVQHAAPMSGMGQGVILTVQEDSGKSCRVHLGPANFVERQNFTFNTGEKITVTGSRITIDNNEVVMARDVNLNGKTLRLRDQGGQPLWTGSGSSTGGTGNSGTGTQGTGPGSSTGSGSNSPD
jgi:sporulation protein YlmC with PRC-barrel domain